MNVFARSLVISSLMFAGLFTSLPAQEQMDVDTVFEESEDSDPSALASLAPEETADPVPTEADTETDEVKLLLQRLDALEKAEKKRAASESKKAADEKAKKDAEAAKADDWIDLSTDKWTVKLGGHVQMEYVDWASSSASIPANQSENYFAYRRLRLAADGTGYGILDFRLQMTLEPGNSGNLPQGTGLSPDVKDAYITVNEIPWVGRVRIGNFFVPFGLEQVTNDTNNIFMERSIPTQGIFTADREVGIALYNHNEDQSLTWATGAFFDNITDTQKDRVDDNQGIRVSGRVNWIPYYDEPSNGRYVIHTGAGVMYTHDQDGIVRFRARPEIFLGPRLIDSGDLLANNYTVGNLEFATVWGPITVQSEAYLCNVRLTKGDSKLLNGAYIHLSYYLTGENRVYERFGQHGSQFGRYQPYSNLFFTSSGSSLGAWEAKARISNLNLTSVGKGVMNDMTFGMNWIWTDRTRVMFDWIHPFASSNTVFGASQANLLCMRMDFNW